MLKRMSFLVLLLFLIFLLFSVANAGNPPLNTGSCGADLTWTFSDDGVLTISGTGAMEDYEYSQTMPPWRQYYWDCCYAGIEVDVREIVVGEGVTAIGKAAFRNWPNLTGVTLPSTLQTIGAEAFYDCKGLLAEEIPSGVTIPGGVTSIGPRAFANCVGLKQIEIPAGAEIDATAFEGVTGLIVFGEAGSPAQTFAAAKGYTFMILMQNPI